MPLPDRSFPLSHGLMAQMAILDREEVRKSELLMITRAIWHIG